MPHSRKMAAFTLRQMTSITFGILKRSPNQTPVLQLVRLISIYRKVNSDAFSGKKARPFNGWNCEGFHRSNNFALPNCHNECSVLQLSCHHDDLDSCPTRLCSLPSQ